MTHNSRYSLSAVGLALLSGGVAGAALTLLMAPQPGRQSREQLRGYARQAEQAEEDVHALAKKATEVLKQAMTTRRKFIHGKKAVLSRAFEAGRTTM